MAALRRQRRSCAITLLGVHNLGQSKAQRATSAELLAASNWEGNLNALVKIQPELAAELAACDPQVEWMFARDAALTAMVEGKWWGGCSVPQKAAEELLASLDVTGAMACFLAPAHAAQLALTLRRLKTQQAVVAVLPKIEELVLALHCHDLADDIAGHRLWFAAGEAWTKQLAALFKRNVGLVIPQQFIRTALLDEEASAALIATAQQIFSDELKRRSELLAHPQYVQIARERPRVTIAAGMQFRLWDNAGNVLAELLKADQGLDCYIINFDDPLNASPLALAEAAAESDALITANITRSDCSNILHPQVPLITWLTRAQIPAFDKAGPNDALLLADRRWVEAARKAGWPAGRVAAAAWPRVAVADASANSLSIIADTQPLEPATPFDLSSHQLLWDMIRSELLANPATLTDVHSYLHSRMARMSIGDDGFDKLRFIEHLILPAYIQGLAKQLLEANLPLRLFGTGWRDIEPFAAHAAGPIYDPQSLQTAVANSAALIHVWPTSHAHPIDTAGPPVLRLGRRGLLGLIEEAQRLLAGDLKPTPPVADPLYIQIRTIRKMLGEVHPCFAGLDSSAS